MGRSSASAEELIKQYAQHTLERLLLGWKACAITWAYVLFNSGIHTEESLQAWAPVTSSARSLYHCRHRGSSICFILPAFLPNPSLLGPVSF